MKIGIVFILSFLLISCGGSAPKVEVAMCGTIQSPMQHTGLMTVTDISIGYCEPAVREKTGTNVCDRSIIYRTDQGQYRTLGLRRSGQWPPVWIGAHGDIWFWLPQDFNCQPEPAVITEFDEMQR